ncbi:hypothetical protein BJ508DRAFT_341158 [Ascobolus immersus RN42]|uniref:Uncharacterized protein n=1 Tax=Ascobolus immersus RN42 TaxID=1160509 RepID=A0A3N4HI07_ASCIM|nr:hypothetical protein BJ508DRAFT_341158 [Ascobolus immersus RN42]
MGHAPHPQAPNRAIYKSHPASPVEYPHLLTDSHVWRSAHLLRPHFRLRTSTGPATLAELLSPSDSTQFYLQILWEHPPPRTASWWTRFRWSKRISTECGGEALEYYTKLARQLWGRQLQVGDCDWMSRHGWNGKEFGVEIREMKVVMGEGCCLRVRNWTEYTKLRDGARMPKEVTMDGWEGVCMFDLLRAVEVERVMREEYEVQKKELAAAAEKEGKKRWWGVRVKHLPYGFRLEQEGMKRGGWERCQELEWMISRALGIQPPPKRGYFGWESWNPERVYLEPKMSEPGYSEQLV